MTTIQTASVSQVVIKVGGKGMIPYAAINQCDAFGCVQLCESWLDNLPLEAMVARGYEIVDPHNYVTCPGCGTLIAYGEFECEGCAQAGLDAADERMMNNELREGM